MTISDEALMAFADDALSGEETQRVAAALTADPNLARKLDRMRRANAALRGAFSGQLEVEIPSHLLTPFEHSPRANAGVVAFPQTARRPLSWLAAAACLALAFLAGNASVGGGVMFARSNGAIVARGNLDEALDRQAAGASDRIQIAMSIPDKGGGYCRVFRLDASTGLACGQGGEWRVEALVASDVAANSSNYEIAAGALPEAILSAANDRRAGDPLDAEAEQRAMLVRWR